MGYIFRGAAFLVLLFPALGAATEKEFASNLAAAILQSRTEQGAAYDRILGTYFMAQPAIEGEMAKCLDNNPGPQRIVGFFEFKKATPYKLHLWPASSFTKCFQAVFEGRHPPAPPFLPYKNPFDFNTEK